MAMVTDSSLDVMKDEKEFFNLYNHGLIRIAVAVPEVRVADPAFNGARTLELMEKAEGEKAILALFPELGLSAYSCDDLFQQQALLDGSLEALRSLLKASAAMNLISVVGMPLRVDHLLFNCAVVLRQGKILGIIPKTFLPNYREFYEYRQFAPAAAAISTAIAVFDQNGIPFGEHLIFQCQEQTQFTFFVEICEDLWVPIPPSCHAALAGATVILNLSASNITIAKDEYRHSLVSNQSARCLAGYLYTAAGIGESTTDLAWDGHAMVYENGDLIGESERFCYESQLVTAELDLERIAQERMRQNSFGQSMQRHREELRQFRRIQFHSDFPIAGRLLSQRKIDRFPYVPPDPHCATAVATKPTTFRYKDLCKGSRAGISKIVIGVSGGLDSTHALIVATRAMDVLKFPRSNILAYTMPAFGTSKHTLANAPL